MTQRKGHSGVEPIYYNDDGEQVFASSRYPLPVIQVDHQRVHEGRMWFARYFWSADSISNNTSVYMLIVIPETVRPHAVFSVTTTGESEIHVYRDPITTDNGTVVTSYNRRDDASGLSTDINVYHTPTISDNGDDIYPDLIAGGIGHKASGADSGFGLEMVLRAGTNYMLEIKNVSGAAMSAVGAIDWYEPPTS